MWTSFPSPLGSRGSCVPATTAVAHLHREKLTVIPFFRSLHRKIRLSVSSCYGLSSTFPMRAYHVRRAKVRIHQKHPAAVVQHSRRSLSAAVHSFLATEHCRNWCQRGNTNKLRPRMKALRCFFFRFLPPLKCVGTLHWFGTPLSSKETTPSCSVQRWCHPAEGKESPG